MRFTNRNGKKLITKARKDESTKGKAAIGFFVFSLFRVFVIALVLSVLGSTSFAQDRIRFFDRAAKKEALASGAIQEETSARLTYKLGTSGAVKEIPSPDVLDVTYEVPGANELDYSRANGEERKAFAGRTDTFAVDEFGR